MWTSRLFLALRIAASVGPMPSSGWTRSSMRSGLVLARLALRPLDSHLVAAVEGHDRARELVRLLRERKLHGVREVFLRRIAQLVPDALLAKKVLQPLLELVRLPRLDADVKALAALRLQGLQDPDDAQDEERGERGHRVDADAGGEPEGEAGEHDARVLGV